MTNLIPITVAVVVVSAVQVVLWYWLSKQFESLKVTLLTEASSVRTKVMTEATAMVTHAEVRAKVAQADLRLALASHGVDLKNTVSVVKQDLTIALEDAKQHMHSAATKLEGDAEIVKTHLQQLADETFARSHSARLPRSVERSK